MLALTRIELLKKMSERLDDDVSSLMKKGNYKLCLQKVLQARKQLPNSSYLRVLEIYIRYRSSPGKFDYESTLGSLYGINGTEVTSDTKALNLLHKFFVEINRYDEALHVYEKANFKYQGFEVALKWFEKTLQDSNYKQMMKASQQLARLGGDVGEGLSSRDFFFWYALSMVGLFRSQGSKATEQEKKLLPQLAYRSLSDVKPFRSAQEVYVFCAVCEELFPGDQEKAQEIVNEVIPQLESGMDLHMKNFLLRNLRKDDHATTFDLCGKLLEKLNDFDVITRYIYSAKNLAKSKRDIIRSIEVSVGDSRNSRLAHLEADKIYDDQISREALAHYLQKFHNKPCCTIDLGRYWKLLDSKVLQEVFKGCECIDVVHETNLFKLGLSQLTPVEAYSKYRDSMLNKSVTDYSTCSTYILKMTKDLILTQDEPSLDNVMLALTLLENYQTKDPHNYETSVWIVALYMYLGCVPLAFSQYLELKTKNVQIDTLDFVIFSRFATMLPLKPHDYIKRAQENLERFYQSSVSRLPQLAQIAFERKSYSKILGILEFKDRIGRSSTRWLMTSESIKMARLCNDKRGAQLQVMHDAWNLLEMSNNLNFSDNRDYGVFGSKTDKDNLPHVLRYLNVDEKCVRLNCLTEFMIELIPSRERNARLESYLDESVTSEALHGSDMTFIDTWSFEIFHDLYANDGTNILEVLQKLSQQPQSTATWRLSHEYLTKMHTLKTLDSFKRIKDSAVKNSIKANIKQLRDSCDDLFSHYMSQISETCEKLREGSNGQLLESLGYVPLDAANINKGLLAVQKAIRNL